MLENKAPCTLRDGNGNAALYAAITHPHKHTPKIIESLLIFGANPEITNSDGVTMFDKAHALTRMGNKYKVGYDALLKYSNSTHVPHLLKRDFLQHLFTEINTKNTAKFFQKKNGLSLVGELPKYANNIYLALSKMDLPDESQINQNFAEIFGLLAKANQPVKFQTTDFLNTVKEGISRNNRLPETGTWYHEKWEAIKAVKALCDQKESTSRSQQPPQYQDYMRSTMIQSQIMNTMQPYAAYPIMLPEFTNLQSTSVGVLPAPDMITSNPYGTLTTSGQYYHPSSQYSSQPPSSVSTSKPQIRELMLVFTPSPAAATSQQSTNGATLIPQYNQSFGF